MRLACLALLAFSTLSLADSIDYQASGTIANHTAFTMGTIVAGKTWEVGDELVQIDDLTTGKNRTGMLGIIDLTTGKLFSCASGLCFTGGSLDIDNAKHGSIFDGVLQSGSISRLHGSTILSAIVSNGAVTVIKLKGGQFSTQALVGTVPEPATLGLFGIGLLAFGFIRRYSLRM